jgi:hypothetical protein
MGRWYCALRRDWNSRCTSGVRTPSLPTRSHALGQALAVTVRSFETPEVTAFTGSGAGHKKVMLGA